MSFEFQAHIDWDQNRARSASSTGVCSALRGLWVPTARQRVQESTVTVIFLWHASDRACPLQRMFAECQVLVGIVGLYTFVARTSSGSRQ